MKIAYYKAPRDYGYYYNRLNPTGRCKLVDSGETGKSQRYVQHKGLIFKHWINVENIEWHDHEEVREFTVPVIMPEDLKAAFAEAQRECDAARAKENSDV